jgi:hypothetical protein
VKAKECPICTLPNPTDAVRCGDCKFDFADWERRGRPGICQKCGVEADTRQIAFHQHIGAIVLMFHCREEGRFCKSCIRSSFIAKTATTLLLGWWGFISFFVTPFVLLHNLGRYIVCARMAPPPQVEHRVARLARRLESTARPAQLVGQNCGICGERISCDLDGRFCGECSSPVHHSCARSGEGSGCPMCGVVSFSVRKSSWPPEGP